MLVLSGKQSVTFRNLAHVPITMQYQSPELTDPGSMELKEFSHLWAYVMIGALAACGGGSTQQQQQPQAIPPAADVVTFKNDVARTGRNLVERTLKPTNVKWDSFGLLHLLPLDGNVEAQPLYLSRLNIGGTSHNVVFVATEHASVYAFDADTGATIWQVSLLSDGELPSDSHGCGGVAPEIGVTATPVIDRSAGPNGALYAVVMSIDKTSTYHQRLHALDVTNGAELFSGPSDITGTYMNAAGITTFDPAQYTERPALLLANGQIYTSWASHCDLPPYGGWIIAFDQTTLAQTSALNVAPNSGIPVVGGSSSNINGPSIWMSGSGPAADAAGNVYLLTANGQFETIPDLNGFPNLGDYANSFLKLTSTATSLAVADYFTVWNEMEESFNDQDLGAGGGMVLPDLQDATQTVKHLIVGGGKDGNIYVVDRDAMGKYNASGNKIWQEVGGQLGVAVLASPAYFNGAVYYGGINGPLEAFSITNAKLSATPTSQSSATFGYAGSSPVVSANGTQDGIVWAFDSSTSILRAYDAANLANELYNNTQASGSRDQLNGGGKFVVPTVADGKVFVTTPGTLAIFGLLN